MTFKNMMKLLGSSARNDWQKIRHLETACKDSACLKEDLSLVIGWNKVIDAEFPAKFKNDCADKSVSLNEFTVLFNNAVVFKHRYLAIDGGKFYIPVPEYQGSKFVVIEEELIFWQFLNRISNPGSKQEAYMDKLGVEIFQTDWLYWLIFKILG